MKENIAKNTLSFSCSKKMKFLRTPVDIWEQLTDEFNFTCDMCASDNNHLVEKYYTIDNTDYRSGIYFYQVFNDRELIQTTQFIVK